MACLKLLFIVFTCMVVLSSSFSSDGKVLYKKCRGCHGSDGKYIPFERKNGVLAGRDKVEIEILIRSIKDGSYSTDRLTKIMRNAISKFSDDDIKIISAYIGQFKN